MVFAHRLLLPLFVSAALLPLSAAAQSKSKAAQAFTFPKACVDCHGSEPRYPVRGARSQYLTSGHRTIGHASYSNSEGCQRCHTNEGFIEYVKKGAVDPKTVIKYPSEIGCFTCHAPHDTGDFSLRKTNAVTLANGTVFDRGKGNLCVNCHRALFLPKDEVKPRSIPFDFWGAHHGPHADMLLGVNAYEVPGKTYSKSAHAMLPGATCVTCHMTMPQQRYALMPTIAGHSFRIGAEVHELPKLNNAGCLSSGCHAEMKQVPGKHVFDRQAAADWDGNGKVETIQEEVQGLLDRIINKQGSGLLQTMKDPLYDAKGAFIRNKTQYPVEVVGALYNWKFVKEDGSRGMHNSKYAVQLLMDSVKALDPKFDDSNRPQ
jgi:formate-dependent nitrite reductase cytochrome c552 subunit